MKASQPDDIFPQASRSNSLFFDSETILFTIERSYHLSE